MNKYTKTVFEYDSLSTPYIPHQDLKVQDSSALPAYAKADGTLKLPNMAESDVVRHYTNLSRKNFGVDVGFYPLGSCTMKYNPRINESIANDRSLAMAHPLIHETRVQGILELLYDFEKILAELSGFDAVTFQPAAGAHGEFTGMAIIKAYHDSRGDKNRVKVVVPDSSHGTNPATASMAGLTVKTIKSLANGLVDLEALKAECDGTTAAFMLTNPNTLGLFEKDILKIAEIVHQSGALLYYDGANFNALMGCARPGDMNFDVMQFNLHKTFSTPHGGGGPGSGPVAVKSFLKEFLPYPIVERTDDTYKFVKPAKTIGKVRTFYGNFAVVVRAYVYTLMLGREGLKRSSQVAVLNANYLLKKIKEFIPVPHPEYCLHEFVGSGEKFNSKGVHTLDIAKRLIDYGYHPPTVYFPLIVKEAIMIEPTETENLETLDTFVADLRKVIDEIDTDPELLHNAPITASVRRVDEAKAARDLLRG